MIRLGSFNVTGMAGHFCKFIPYIHLEVYRLSTDVTDENCMYTGWPYSDIFMNHEALCDYRLSLDPRADYRILTGIICLFKTVSFVCLVAACELRSVVRSVGFDS